MRTPAAFLGAGLFGVTSLALRSPVYFSSPSTSFSQNAGSDAPSISWRDARLYLADRAGVSDEYSLDGTDETTIRLMGQAQGSQQRLFTSYPVARSVVIVEGVEDPEGLFDEDIKPHFYVDTPPSMHDNLDTVSTFLEQDRHRRGAKQTCVSYKSTNGMKDSIQGGFSLSDPFGTCELQSIQSGAWWKGLSNPEKFDIISAPTAILNRIYGKKVQAASASTLTSVFHVRTLHEIAASHGTTSSLYRSSRKALKESLRKLRDSGAEATIVLSPYTRSKGLDFDATDSRVQKRADRVLDIGAAAETSPSETVFPKTTIASCYSNEEACVSVTANCSGHGACTLKWTETNSDDEMGAECWACVCQPTILIQGGSDGSGRKTIYWGGPACQKKDISVQFWLFAGFAIAIAGALSYGIGMLLSIGQSELPSVLGSGVGPGARAK